MAGQLVLPFGVQAALGPEDFILSRCNEAAFRFVESWPDWPAPAAALHGPEGSGKTHLARIWAGRSGAAILHASELTAEIPARLDSGLALVVEDVDAVAPGLERDWALFALLERKSGALLLTGRTPPAEWPVLLGDLTSRLAALLGFTVWAPDEALLAGLARKLFADRQLQVPDAVIRRILLAVDRTPTAISAFVAQLDDRSLAERRPVTERLVLDLLDGMEATR